MLLLVQWSATSQLPEADRHCTVGAYDDESAVHVPLVVPPALVLHAMQSLARPPPQLVLQQTPSTQ